MAGIYIHIPFCRKKCTYCDFHFSTTFDEYRDQMVACIVEEISARKHFIGNEIIETIYFGGGTPSILDKNEINTLLRKVAENFTVHPDAEITLEANPDDISPDKISVWREQGINRLSIGIQSFRQKDLDWMNRSHTVQQAINCINIARDGGIKNLTIDLIYGLPDMSMDEWEQQINQVIELGINHISAYCLTVEKNTALHHLVKTGKISTADEDRQSEEFQLLVELLEASGYVQYEISNFSKPGFTSRHNSNYWKGIKYLGIGPSAHSYNGLIREWNVAHNRKYMAAIQKNRPEVESEILSDTDRFNESILTGLRTIYGVDLNALKLIKNPTDLFWDSLNEFIQSGHLTKNNDVLLLTKPGKLIADHIASELFITEK